MSKTSGYIAFPDDFLPGPIELNKIIVSKSKYDFITSAISTGKVGRIHLPSLGTFFLNCVEFGELVGYLTPIPGETILIMPYREEVEDDIVYGINFAGLDGA